LKIIITGGSANISLNEGIKSFLSVK
jgi:hypothetical protein